MPEEGCRPGAQQPRLYGISQFCQCSHEVRAARALDHGVVAGQLPEHGQAGAREPHEWMKPQPAKGDLVDETDQVVASPRVCHFMDEHSVELPVIQQAIDSERQRDVWAQDSVNRGALPGRG